MMRFSVYIDPDPPSAKYCRHRAWIWEVRSVNRSGEATYVAGGVCDSRWKARKVANACARALHSANGKSS